MSHQDYNSFGGNIYETTKHFVGTDSESPWITWNKPNNCKLVYFLCIGGGGGGAGGPAMASGTYASGAVPGGGAGTMSMLIPAMFLPNTLYIKPGYCGSAGSGAIFGSVIETSGGPGGSSFVCYYPDSSQGNRICFANGGTGGAVSGHQVSSSVIDGTMVDASNIFYGHAGIRQHMMPQLTKDRTNTNTYAGLYSFDINNSNTMGRDNNICTPGLFGNSTTSAGASVFDTKYILFGDNSTSYPYPFPALSNSNSLTTPINGLGYGLDLSYTGDDFFYGNIEGGPNSNHGFYFCGGGGGYFNTLSGTAGHGGHGGIGSGGGGGGACGNAITNGRGGNGGRGGPGLISIVCI